MHGTGPRVWNALIRTHHITSRKKVAKLKQAATANDVFVLLRSGGSPGIMYVEGSQKPVEEWVAAVHVSQRPRADERCNADDASESALQRLPAGYASG